MSKAHAYEELLRAGRWFGGLDESFRRALLDASILKKATKNERIFSRGDAPNGFYALVDGSVQILGYAPSGAEVPLALVEPPMWFGENSLFDREPRFHDAVSTDESTYVHVPAHALEAILARTPKHWRDLGVLVTARTRLLFIAMEDAGEPVTVRLTRRLVLSAERYGEWHDRSSRVVGLRQAQLATMLGTSRQTVNQILKELEAKGWVRLAYGSVEIVDLDALRAASEAKT